MILKNLFEEIHAVILNLIYGKLFILEHSNLFNTGCYEELYLVSIMMDGLHIR